MTPQERQEFENMKQELRELRSLYFKGDMPNKKVFDKKVELQFKTLANGIKLYSPTNMTGIDILTGGGNTNASIVAEIGSGLRGIYFSTDPAAPVFINLSGTWTLLNIP